MWKPDVSVNDFCTPPPEIFSWLLSLLDDITVAGQQRFPIAGARTELTREASNLLHQFYLYNLFFRPCGSSASEQDSCVEQPANLYPQPGTSGYQSHSCPDWIMPESEPEHEEKPPPLLTVLSQPSESLEQQKKTETQQATNGSASPFSSCGARVSLTPSPRPARREDVLFSHHQHHRGVLPHVASHDHGEMQLMSAEEHEIIMENQRKFGLYLDEKRESLKRKQVLEEDLLRAKIRVEELKAARLQQGLPALQEA
ncbi:fibrinogen silencer-binding protein-like [Heterodontus francisci]|uniref:fibrinogen silencer-binding protein-like n=1 Tax=Heterodontus francisci TaxID=7792 RepID=UPI00355AFF6C